MSGSAQAERPPEARAEEGKGRRSRPADEAREAGGARSHAEDLPDIATDQEIRQLLTDILRGEPFSGADRPPSIAERLKAVELLGKSTGLWTAAYREAGEAVEFVGDEYLEG